MIRQVPIPLRDYNSQQKPESFTRRTIVTTISGQQWSVAIIWFDSGITITPLLLPELKWKEQEYDKTSMERRLYILFLYLSKLCLIKKRSVWLWSLWKQRFHQTKIVKLFWSGKIWNIHWNIVINSSQFLRQEDPLITMFWFYHYDLLLCNFDKKIVCWCFPTYNVEIRW